MSFAPSRIRPSGRSSGAPVLAVGQRVFVHCAGERGDVVLDDENGHASRTSLPDGVEVEVIAWRPRGQSGTRYRIRVGRDGADGWVHASNLRTTLVRPAPTPTDPVAEPPKPAVPAGRRFGERAWSSR